MLPPCFQKFITSTPRTPLLSSLQPGACQRNSKLPAVLIPPVLGKKTAIKYEIHSKPNRILDDPCKMIALSVKGENLNQAWERTEKEQENLFLSHVCSLIPSIFTGEKGHSFTSI